MCLISTSVYVSCLTIDIQEYTVTILEGQDSRDNII